MRKPRDIDAELAALDARAKGLKARKVQQLGELVIATGADRLTIDELAGALIVIAETKDPAKREGWARRGRDYFQGSARKSSTAAQNNTGQLPPPLGHAPPA
ncbi:MAG: conjugal transfer protein TraD [Sphingopyxis sp.]|nr:conjugal transfer protein TraD [Sphingopyxis sp.]